MSDDNFDWPSHNLENAQLEENLDKIKRQVAEDYKKNARNCSESCNQREPQKKD